jgi:hypothetical protein
LVEIVREQSNIQDDFPGLKGRISVSAGRPIAFKLPVPAVSDTFFKFPMATQGHGLNVPDGERINLNPGTHDG